MSSAHRSRRHRAHRARRRPGGLRPDRPGGTGGSANRGAQGCHARRNAGFGRSTRASTRSTSSRSFRRLHLVASDNAQREYYLPDLIAIFRRAGRRVAALAIDRPDEILGINTRAELASMSDRVWNARRAALMAAGVTLEDPATTYVDAGVVVGPDTVIRPNVSLQGRTRIGASCTLHTGVRMVDCEVADGVTILDHCLVLGARIAEGVHIGPFAHIRPDTEICANAHIGNFVELKKTKMGAGSKANHLAYLGDATIGEKVNIGAGTITCNYDGVRKNPTVIEDGVFIGSDSQLIAPVTIGHGLVRGGRLDHHERRSARLAGDRAGQAGEQGRLDQAEEAAARNRKEELGGSRRAYVRHHRLHRPEARRSRPHRRPAAPRIPRLRLGRHRRGAATGAIDLRRSAGKLSRPRRGDRGRSDRRANTASATRAGPRTAARPRRTPTRTATARAGSWSCTTASSRTTSS